MHCSHAFCVVVWSVLLLAIDLTVRITAERISKKINMNKTLCIAVVGCFFAPTLSADSVRDIKHAFSEGLVEGDVVLYGEKQNNSGANRNAGFAMGSVGLGYETAAFHGIKAALGFRGNHDISEVESGDYADDGQPSALLHTANISYTNEYYSLTLGRQEIDLEWMGDFHEAYVAAITAIPDATIVIGHTDRKAAADADAPLEKFAKVNAGKGANVFDIKYEGIEGLALNGYYYNAKDLADWFGAKVDYDADMFGTTLHYANSNEKVAADDGSVLAAELRGTFEGFALNLGYIKTDKDGAIGSMDAIGDNINPLEDGNRVYATDAKTIYLGVSYEIANVALTAMYGNSDYESNKHEKEINIGAEYSYKDELTLRAFFVNVNADDSDDDYNKLTLTATYSF